MPEDKRAIAAATARLVAAAREHGVLSQPLLVNINVPAGFAAREPVRLTRPARFTLFEGVRPEGEPIVNGERITVRVRYGNIFDGPGTDDDETGGAQGRRGLDLRHRSVHGARRARGPVARHRPRVLTRCMMQSHQSRRRQGGACETAA